MDWLFLRDPFSGSIVSRLRFRGLDSFPGALSTFVHQDTRIQLHERCSVLGHHGCVPSSGLHVGNNMSVSATTIACSIMATIAAFAMWGTAKSLSPFIVFSILHGFFGYSFTTMRVAIGEGGEWRSFCSGCHVRHSGLLARSGEYFDGTNYIWLNISEYQSWYLWYWEVRDSGDLPGLHVFKCAGHWPVASDAEKDRMGRI